MPRPRTLIHGFTLVELAIVLVIIGLIVGGVLAGQELITQAGQRKLIAQVRSIDEAAITFRLKYGKLPGDIDNAATFFNAGSQPDQVTSGNGNGVVDSWGGTRTKAEYESDSLDYIGDATNSEIFKFFDHLAAAKLITLGQFDETSASANAAGVGYPKAALQASGEPHSWMASPGTQPGVGVYYYPGYYSMRAGNKIVAGLCYYTAWGDPNGAVSAGCGYMGEITHTIDMKIDDGKPFTGSMRIVPVYPYMYRLPGNPQSLGTTFCADETTNTYRHDGNGYGAHIRGCSPAFDASF